MTYVYPRERSERLRPEDAEARAELGRKSREAREARERAYEEVRREQALQDAKTVSDWLHEFEEALAEAEADSGQPADSIAWDVFECFAMQIWRPEVRAEVRRCCLG